MFNGMDVACFLQSNYGAALFWCHMIRCGPCQLAATLTGARDEPLAPVTMATTGGWAAGTFCFFGAAFLSGAGVPEGMFLRAKYTSVIEVP